VPASRQQQGRARTQQGPRFDDYGAIGQVTGLCPAVWLFSALTGSSPNGSRHLSDTATKACPRAAVPARHREAEGRFAIFVGSSVTPESGKLAEAFKPTGAKSVPQPKISIDWSGIRPLSRTGSHCISSLGFIKVYTAFRPRSITASFATKNTQTNKAGISRLIYQILKAAFCPH
jgi:hypothetical protein